MTPGLTGLALPEPQLYIVLAITVAITAIVTGDIREPNKLLPRSLVNLAAVLLFIAVSIGIGQIGFAVASNNLLSEDTAEAAVLLHLIAHTLSLAVVFAILCVWYVAVAVYKPSPASLPTNPTHEALSGSDG